MNKKVLLGTIAVLSSTVPTSWGGIRVTICDFPAGNPANVQRHVVNHAGDGVYGSFGDGARGMDSSPPGSGSN
jgi:hypothetical protein